MVSVKHNRCMDWSLEMHCCYLYITLMGEGWNSVTRTFRKTIDPDLSLAPCDMTSPTAPNYVLHLQQILLRAFPNVTAIWIFDRYGHSGRPPNVKLILYFLRMTKNQVRVVDLLIICIRGASVNRSQIDIKSKICDIRIWKKTFIFRPTLIHLSRCFTRASKLLSQPLPHLNFNLFINSETFATQLWTALRDKHFPP
jgi:hypothetical protein